MANQAGRGGQAEDTPCLRKDTASALFPHASTYSPMSPENKMGRKTNKVQIKKRNTSTGTPAAQRYEMEMGVNGRYRFVSPTAPGPAPRGIVQKAPQAIHSGQELISGNCHSKGQYGTAPTMG